MSKARRLNRVLVANRGEIAVRVIRACREEGIESVAVFSEADRHGLHVTLADYAVEIGPAAASDSYLNIDRLIDAAKEMEADAVHPGYGFLAERAEFAEAVANAGLIFVGPSASAIKAMGEKTEARRRMQESGVPVVPGTVEPIDDVDEGVRTAEEIGFPVLLKAVAGGGGKGMRRIDAPGDFKSGFEQAQSEAKKSFGNGAVYIEKFIDRPRHVEIQVMADSFGTTVHVGERECSVQRRHQKMIEEAPSPAVSAELRQTMGNAAIKAAQSVGYVGAGTVEFLLDPSGTFYFLEMNTRIQVEHPITEMVYGVDLVREQLRVAAGQKVSFVQADVIPRGHAIECRITSEDPYNGFLPRTGTVEHFEVPGGPGVRWDGGIGVGSEVGLHYDPLVGKLIVWGEDRQRAIERMLRAIDEFVLVGLPTSIPFHRSVMGEPSFVSGEYDIGYLEQHGDELLQVRQDDLDGAIITAVLAEHRSRRLPKSKASEDSPETGSNWTRIAREETLRW